MLVKSSIFVSRCKHLSMAQRRTTVRLFSWGRRGLWLKEQLLSTDGVPSSDFELVIGGDGGDAQEISKFYGIKDPVGASNS